MADFSQLDLGIMVEGVVELDPMTGLHVIRVEGNDGKNTFISVQDAVSRYRGQDVRFILTPMATIGQLAEMVNEEGVPLEQIPTLKSGLS